VLRQVVQALSSSRVTRALPFSSVIVKRFVAGEHADQAVLASELQVSDGLYVLLDHVGPEATDLAGATAGTEVYVDLLRRLTAAKLTRYAEVLVRLSAVGQALPDDGDKIALENARTICRTARNAGTTVTIDMEHHTTTDSTLGILHELRQDFPETGAVLHAALRRTEADCRDLAHTGSRVRLLKGEYAEPESVAYQRRAEIDKSYVRCLRVLMNGSGRPMVATHDPRLIRIAASLADRAGRQRDTYEYHMLYGVHPEEQRRLAGVGHTVRVDIPYGESSAGHLIRRFAQHPGDLRFFARSLITGT
jgi:proline dehydrogenase